MVLSIHKNKPNKKDSSKHFGSYETQMQCTRTLEWFAKKRKANTSNKRQSLHWEKPTS